MTIDPRTPVIVGTAQVNVTEHASEPIELPSRVGSGRGSPQ